MTDINDLLDRSLRCDWPTSQSIPDGLVRYESNLRENTENV